MFAAMLVPGSRKSQYQVYATLQGSKGPMNAVAISDDTKLLASGGEIFTIAIDATLTSSLGDAEEVKIWDLDEQKAVYTLSDNLGRWGQITAVKWLRSVADGYTICFGTGRGWILVYRKSKDTDSFRELTSVYPFSFNEPVEAMDYDRQNERLVASSHGGKLVMYTMNKRGSFEKVWSKNLNDMESGKATIPRSVQFVPGGESVITCGLESGIVFSKTIATGSSNWNKTLRSSIGSSKLSPNGNFLLIDNLTSGFDIYSYPSLGHMETFKIQRAQSRLIDGAFMEGSSAFCCGSDHGVVYVFSSNTFGEIQQLRAGTRKSMIQAVDAITHENFHFLAAATSDDYPNITVWRKTTKAARARPTSNTGCSLLVLGLILNAFVLAGLFGMLMMKSDLDKVWRFDGLGSLHLQNDKSSSGATGHHRKRPLTDPTPVWHTEESDSLHQQAADALERFRVSMLRKGVNIDDPNWREKLTEGGSQSKDLIIVSA